MGGIPPWGLFSDPIRLTGDGLQPGDAAGSLAGKLATNPAAGLALSIVSGQFTLNGRQELLSTTAATAPGSTRTVRVRASRAEPYLQIDRDFAVTIAESSWPGGVYLDTGVIAATASLQVTLANGWYGVLVEGATKQWKEAKPTEGVYTITPANADATFTRARFYGPYALTPNTDDIYGARLVAGMVVGESLAQTRAQSYGLPALAVYENVSAAVRTGPSRDNSHQGWTTDAVNNFVSDSTRLYKVARDVTWSDVATVHALTDLPGAGSAGRNHCSDIATLDGLLYAACENLLDATVGTASNQICAIRSTANLSLVDSFTLTEAGSNEVGGVGIDEDAGTLLFCSYTTVTSPTRPLYLYNLASKSFLGELAMPDGFNSIQGVTARDGLIYAAGTRINSGARSVIRLTGTGVLHHVFNVDSLYPSGGSIEGLNFDADGLLGVMHLILTSGALNTGFVQFFDANPTVTNWGPGGFLMDGNRVFMTPGLQPSGAFGVIMKFKPSELSTYNLLDSGQGGLATDWELVINGSGVCTLRGPADAGIAAQSGATAGAWSVFGAGFDPPVGGLLLYANGAQKNVRASGTVYTFPANGSLSFGGNHPGNTRAKGRFAYGLVFASMPTTAEFQALQADPFRVWTPLNALSAAQKAAIEAG